VDIIGSLHRFTKSSFGQLAIWLFFFVVYWNLFPNLQEWYWVMIIPTVPTLLFIVAIHLLVERRIRRMLDTD
jgi:hypothetical protein